MLLFSHIQAESHLRDKAGYAVAQNSPVVVEGSPRLGLGWQPDACTHGKEVQKQLTTQRIDV